MVSSGDSTEKVPIRSHILEQPLQSTRDAKGSTLIMLDTDAQYRSNRYSTPRSEWEISAIYISLMKNFLVN